MFALRHEKRPCTTVQLHELSSTAVDHTRQTYFAVRFPTATTTRRINNHGCAQPVHIHSEPDASHFSLRSPSLQYFSRIISLILHTSTTSAVPYPSFPLPQFLPPPRSLPTIPTPKHHCKTQPHSHPTRLEHTDGDQEHLRHQQQGRWDHPHPVFQHSRFPLPLPLPPQRRKPSLSTDQPFRSSFWMRTSKKTQRRRKLWNALQS
ncbi:hypothetical protein BC829DRAFT_169502 [Chytridium lagenaria]|nr:hypothetical protein BC829DRAFT_169502 [Chytridium lagenaria]